MDDCDAPDAWLWRVMQKEKNREMIAILEDTLNSFLDSEQTSLRFPPRNAFNRRVCHAVASRYRLAHRLEPMPRNPAPDAVCLVLIKTPHSAAPPTRLATFAAAPLPPSSQPHSNPTTTSSNTSTAQTDPDKSIPSNQDPTSTPARFLRRPNSGNSKPARPRIPHGSSLPSSSTPALRSISEEEYQKARARIFKPSSATTTSSTPLPDNQRKSQADEAKISGQLARVAKTGEPTIAKGPVDGSAGFERRRNSRPSAQNSDRSTSSLRSNGHADSSRSSQPRPRDTSSDSRPSTTSSAATQQPSATNTVRRQTNYPSESNRVDLQDPDFDRRYDKWAVRHPAPQQPPPQPIPVPIFTQLLYPYTVQAPHSVHPSNMPISSAAAAMQQALPQYQSIVHHPPSAVMFSQFGHGLSNEFENGGTNALAMSTGFVNHRGMSAGEAAVSTSQAFANHISAQRIGAQVSQKASPAYGLDSTVDFPPLQ